MIQTEAEEMFTLEKIFQEWIDYLIDIGPEGGKNGGGLVGQGTPESIIKLKNSYTGKYLAKELKTKK